MFEKYITHFTPLYDGVKMEYEFMNGYGASVVRHQYSYGNKDGLWELAVLKDGSITYDTEISDDVVGYLSWEDVEKILSKIKDLPDDFDEKKANCAAVKYLRIKHWDQYTEHFWWDPAEEEVVWVQFQIGFDPDVLTVSRAIFEKELRQAMKLFDGESGIRYDIVAVEKNTAKKVLVRHHTAMSPNWED